MLLMIWKNNCIYLVVNQQSTVNSQLDIEFCSSNKFYIYGINVSNNWCCYLKNDDF